MPSVNSGVIGPARLQPVRALTPRRHHGRKVGKEPHWRRKRRWKGYGDQQEEEEEVIPWYCRAG